MTSSPVPAFCQEDSRAGTGLPSVGGILDREIQDQPRDVQAGGRLQSLEAGGRVDLDDLWPDPGLEHVHPRQREPGDPRRFHRHPLVLRRQKEDPPLPSSVDVRAELADPGDAPHRGDDLSPTTIARMSRPRDSWMNSWIQM